MRGEGTPKKAVPLFRQVPKNKEKFVICAFDMETRGLGGEFIICAFWAEDGTQYLAYTIEDTFNFMVEHPYYRYMAHNASGYEFAYLYPTIKNYFDHRENIEIKPTIQGESRIVQFVIKKNGRKWLDIRDSLCLFNASLSSVADSFCPDFPKGEPPWNELHDNFDPTSELWMDYLWRDCEVILIAYRKHVENIWGTFHCNLGVTAGSTSMKAFMTTLEDGYAYYRLHEKTEAFMREGYYGAAVFPGHMVGDWGRVAAVDVNGAYGYQMGKHMYPCGNPGYTHKYHPDKLGMYRVVAHVPPSVYKEIGFNPIPHRTRNGLIWETGEFETVITNIEIAYGLKVGCTFDIVEGWIFVQAEPVFKSFIDKCQELELRDGGIYKPTIKLLRNTCYGKFGTKPIHNVMIFQHEIPDGKWIPLTNEDTGEIIEGVYTGTEPTDAPYIMPHWAAFITAYERIYLFEFMEEAYKHGAKNIYCDTDSIQGDADVILGMIEDGTIPIGRAYGEFKLEEITTHFLLVGPKTYYRLGPEGQMCKAKGIPKKLLNRSVYEDALSNSRKQIPFVSVQGVVRLIKKNGGALPVRRKRTITDIKNSTAWEVDEMGNIYPHGYKSYCESLVNCILSA